ncbi:MAG: Type 1 glutamine amidotransferase-like domain-containing protein [Fibromonadales bacterium]|nr:Type 1 glutamine amidotransferase-like domain-containing protein [Fibromonadales bacterium]
MAIILASRLKLIPQDDINKILANIKKYTPKYESIVFVANNPDDERENNEFSKMFFESFEAAGLMFKNKTILDNKNKEQASALIENADLIILCGGNVPKQNEFFWQTGIKKSLASTKALIIGISAGAMNLCEKAFCLPESRAELSEHRWFDGLGFFSKVLVPHFNGVTTRPYNGINIDEYTFQKSYEYELLGFPNDSYILLDKEGTHYFGDFYAIKDGKITIFTPIHNFNKGTHLCIQS